MIYIFNFKIEEEKKKKKKKQAMGRIRTSKLSPVYTTVTVTVYCGIILSMQYTGTLNEDTGISLYDSGPVFYIRISCLANRTNSKIDCALSSLPAFTFFWDNFARTSPITNMFFFFFFNMADCG